jgi:hypothetical protein
MVRLLKLVFTIPYQTDVYVWCTGALVVSRASPYTSLNDADDSCSHRHRRHCILPPPRTRSQASPTLLPVHS